MMINKKQYISPLISLLEEEQDVFLLTDSQTVKDTGSLEIDDEEEDNDNSRHSKGTTFFFDDDSDDYGW